MEFPENADLSGKTFGRITVDSFSHLTGKYRRFWCCRCACGRKRVLREDYIKGDGVTCSSCRRIEIQGRTGDKVCPQCEQSLSRSEFNADSSTTDGLNRYCKGCSRSIAAKIRGKRQTRRLEGVVLPKEKRCPACDLVKPAEDFWTDKSNADGLKSRCSDCSASYHREWYMRWPKKHIRKVRFSRYGLTPDDAVKMLDSQNHQCDICKRELGSEKDWHIDHDHSSGKVRSLLCKQCNCGLGQFGDSIETMKAAIAYLEKHSPQESGKQSGGGNNPMEHSGTSGLRTSQKISLDYETKRGLCAMARAGYPDLTRCETEVLQCFLGGLTAKAIAEALQTNYATIASKHLPNLRKKFRVQNNVDLVLASVWFGFIEPGLPKTA